MRATPTSVPVGRGPLPEAISASIASSSASLSLNPSPPKNLIPLSGTGLCEALIITPAAAPSRRVTHATAGVGTIPSDTVSRPADVIPATIAASSIVPEQRVSRPRDRPAVAVRDEHAGSGPADRKRKLRSQILVGDPANAVGSKQTAHSCCVCPVPCVRRRRTRIRSGATWRPITSVPAALIGTGRTISSTEPA